MFILRSQDYRIPDETVPTLTEALYLANRWLSRGKVCIYYGQMADGMCILEVTDTGVRFRRQEAGKTCDNQLVEVPHLLM